MIYIPDQEEPITLTREEYPDLPFKKIKINNPREFNKKIDLYHKLMVEAYYKGLFKFQGGQVNERY